MGMMRILIEVAMVVDWWTLRLGWKRCIEIYMLESIILDMSDRELSSPASLCTYLSLPRQRFNVTLDFTYSDPECK